MMIPRWLHRLYAHARGYFWLPCPVCREMFGGHEIKPWHSAMIMRNGHAKVVCPKPLCSLIADCCNEIPYPHRRTWTFLP